ncbi:oxidoreductase-like domain-containing protein [Phenylobacterium sp.]|uniref:oxidoreductase-like domain-containing protein n=1 Tax=Phenylobacterium sp. TaxID=1871053 RepID=UPI0035AFA3F7
MSLPPGVPRRPEQPDDEMCCKRGCDPCIFDYYERALDRWEAKVRALGHDPAQLVASGSGVTPKA